MRHGDIRDALAIEGSPEIQEAFRLVGVALKHCRLHDIKAVVTVGQLSDLDPKTGKREMMAATAFNLDGLDQGLAICDIAKMTLIDHQDRGGEGAIDL